MLISNSTEACQHPLASGQRFSRTGGLKLKHETEGINILALNELCVNV